MASAWGKSWGSSWGNAWGVLASIAPEVEDVLGSRRRSRRSVVDRLASGKAFAHGQALVDVAGARELVRPMAASGLSTVLAGATREIVGDVALAGAADVVVGIRSERVPVFNDEELLALAVWASRRRH